MIYLLQIICLGLSKCQRQAEHIYSSTRWQQTAIDTKKERDLELLKKIVCVFLEFLRVIWIVFNSIGQGLMMNKSVLRKLKNHLHPHSALGLLLCSIWTAVDDLDELVNKKKTLPFIDSMLKF